MTTDKRDELVWQVTDKYANTGCRYAAPSVVRMAIAAAAREMYSLARAETAKEVIEAAAAMCRIVASDCETGRYYERHYEVSAAQMCEKAVRALASRYAETPEATKEGK